MAKNAHLTYDERLTIQSSLADHLSFKAIGLILGKDPSTISKEVKGHIKIVETNAYNSMLKESVEPESSTAIPSVPIRRAASKLHMK